MIDFSPLIVLIILMLVGFFSRRLYLLKDEHVNAVPAILLNIAYPALVLTSVTSVDISSLAGESIIVIAATFLITLILFFAGQLGLKKYKNCERKPIIVFNLAIGNISYVVLPVVRAVFGDAGVYYALLHSATQDILIWTVYYGYFRSGGGRNKTQLKKLISPCFLALIVSVILALFRVRFTGVAESVLKPLSGLTIPLALIYIGGVLGACSDLKRWLPDMDTIILSVTRVILLPLAVYAIMLMIFMPHDLRFLMALVFSAPATLMSTVWAKQFNCDYEFSIKLLLFSTVVFLLAMIPFFMIVK